MKKVFQNEWTRVVLVLTVLCVLSLVPSFMAIFQGAWPFDDDAVSLFGPWREWTHGLLQSGVLPLWNPHLFLGMPFMSNGQSSILYAPNIVYWIFPIRNAMLMDAIFHGVVLGTGGYALARALYRSQSASWLCALCLMLGSSVAAHLSVGHTTWHATRAFLPWILWALIWFLRKRQSKHLFALAVFFVLQLFAGYPPYVLWSACWCIVFFGAWLWAGRVSLMTALRLVCSRRVLLPGVLLLLLSAVIVLPLRETSSQSTHGAEIPFRIAVVPAATLYSWVRLALPNFFGGNRNAQWSIKALQHEEAGYIGLLPLGLALLAPLLWRWKNESVSPENSDASEFDARRFADALWLIIPIAFILSLGAKTPVYQWLYDALPPLRMFRVPARWFEIWFLAACVLAALGWDAALQLPAHRKKTLFAGIAIFAFILFIGAVVISFWPVNSSLWMETAQWTKRSIAADFAVRLQYATYLKSLALQSVIFAIGVLVGALLIILRARSAPPTAKWNWRNGLLILMACDLILIFWSSSRFAQEGWPKKPWPHGIENYYHKGDRWNTAFEDDVFRYGLDQGLPHKIDSLGGYDALGSQDFFTFAGAIEKQNYWSSEYQASHLDPLLRAAAVTHVFASQNSPWLKILPRNNAKLIAQFGAGKKQTQLWKLPYSWPRAFVSSIVARADRENQLKLLQTMAAGSTPGVVSDVEAFPNFKNSSNAGESKLKWSRGNNFSVFQIETLLPQILVETEAFAPGWRAWINEKPTKIERVNFLFRGVEVPAGKSRVVFLYDNQTFRVGIFLSLLGLALASGVLGFAGMNLMKEKNNVEK